MVNNLTASDVADRAAQIQKAIWPEFKDWFANYLVVKRAAQVRCQSANTGVMLHADEV